MVVGSTVPIGVVRLVDITDVIGWRKVIHPPRGPMYILHGAPTSPFVRKTWIFMKEKGLEFEHRQLDPLDKSDRFLKMNPLGRIPILEEADGNLISDSSVICDYLENTHPEPALYPSDHRERARALWLEEYGDILADTDVRTHLLDVHHHSLPFRKTNRSG